MKHRIKITRKSELAREEAAKAVSYLNEAQIDLAASKEFTVKRSVLNLLRGAEYAAYNTLIYVSRIHELARGRDPADQDYDPTDEAPEVARKRDDPLVWCMLFAFGVGVIGGALLTVMTRGM